MEFMIVADRRNGQASRTLGRLRISEIQRDSAVGIWSNPYNVNPNDIQAGDFVLLVESPYKTGDVSLPESEAEAAKSAKLSEPDAGKTDEEGPKKKTEEPLPKKKKAEDQGSGEGW